jgi:alanine dehydrogenase
MDPTRPVVPNAWLAALPVDAVVLDLAADPYDFSVEPPRIKGIEGVPHGDLDQWIFGVDDPAWDALDTRVRRVNRRTALSCYSWPGLHPFESMQRYGAQLEPVMAFILAHTIEDRGEEHGDSSIERAVARADTARFLQRVGVHQP